MKVNKALTVFVLFFIALSSRGQQDMSQGFTYIQIDSAKQMWGDWAEPEWLRYFGLDTGDINRDGYMDIISGRYIYHNPGKSMQEHWKRTVLDDNVDGILFMDVDGDAYADIIAMALPQLYWYEAINTEGTRYKRKQIGQVPATSHVNSQGFEKVQLIAGGLSEFVIAGNGDIYAVEIPNKDAETTTWKVKMICENTSDEGIGVGDIDGDGDLDIAAGRRPEGEEEPKILVWYENPGHIDTLWKPTLVGESKHPIDRVEIADVDGDNKADIIVTEERYPGLEPDANFWWFGQKSLSEWTQNQIVEQYSINNLDLTDFDKDGDIDLLTAEHKGEALELQLWKNDGKGNFSKNILDTGKENHLGTQWADLDNDGDLDIIGAGWDQHQYVHVWRNDAIQQSNTTPKKKLKNTEENSVEITEGSYEDRPHYIVHTKAVTYYYDKAGGGFSRIIDAYGNDWIGYKTEPWDQYPASAASSYRGLPNLVFSSEDSGAGHPGHDRCVSNTIFKSTIHTKTKTGKWEWQWTFFDEYAVLEVLDTEENTPYWFLYEGTPGGNFKPESYSYGTNVSGPHFDLPDFYKNDIKWGHFQWAYFSRKNIDNSFFVAQVAKDEHVDMISYLGNTDVGVTSKDGMTVFGFGRGPDTKPLLTGKYTFIIGMVNFSIADQNQHQKITDRIAAAIYRIDELNKKK